MSDKGKDRKHGFTYGFHVGGMIDQVAVEAEKERVAFLVEHQPFGQWTVEKPVIEIHQGFPEKRVIHGFRRADDGPESHMGENVAIDVDPRRHLDQFETLRCQFENASFGHIENRLSVISPRGGPKT